MGLEVNSKNSTLGAIFLWLITKEEAFIGLALKWEHEDEHDNSKADHQIECRRAGHKAEIDRMLARLQALSAEHFGYSPDEITWSHAEGPLRRAAQAHH